MGGCMATARIFDIRGVRDECTEVGKYLGNQMIEEHRTRGKVLLYRPDLTSIIRLQRQKMLDFYRLPAQEKKKSARPQFHHQTGWTPPATEISKEAIQGVADPKERYFYPAYQIPKGQSIYKGVLYLDRVVPQEIPGWEDTCEKWCEGMLDNAYDHLWCLGLAMCNDEGALIEMIEEGPHLVASTYCRYQENLVMPGTKHVLEHLDLNFMSYHNPAAEGLYFKNPDGLWEALDVPEDCIAGQVSEQMQLWTETHTVITLKATEHMVITDYRVLSKIAEAHRKGEVFDRVANQFFLHGNPHAVIDGIELGAQVTAKLLDIGLGSEEELRQRNPEVQRKVQEYRKHMRTRAAA